MAEYTYSNWLNLFRKARLVINNERAELVMENCAYSNNFWTLFPSRLMSCKIQDLTKFDKSLQGDVPYIHLKFPKGRLAIGADDYKSQFPILNRELTALVEKYRPDLIKS